MKLPSRWPYTTVKSIQESWLLPSRGSTVGSGLLGRHSRPLILGRFRFISKVRICFLDGRLCALPICWLALFNCNTVGAGSIGPPRSSLHRFLVPVYIHVHGRFPDIHHSVLRDGVPNCPPPPGSWGRALLLIREANPSPRISLRFPPDGGPSPSLAISSSSQSMTSRPSTPCSMNGKVTSNVGQWVALWPVFPHEKHLTSDQLCRTGRVWTAGFATVFLWNTFVTLFLTLSVRPALERPVWS